MSSNIKVQRICQWCGIEFTAKTTVTKYCSGACGKRSYKDRIKKQKINQCNKETYGKKILPIETLKAKEFLNAREVSYLLGCSLRTVYRLINNGTIKAVNLSERLTRIKRHELNKLLEPPKQPKYEYKHYDIAECYTVNDVQTKYGVSDKALQGIIERNKIPKIKKGRYAYVPKTMIDKILT